MEVERLDTDYLFTVCCPICGTVAFRSFQGAKTFIHCSKCSAELFCETKVHGTTVKVTKEPKNPPTVPPVPA